MGRGNAGVSRRSAPDEADEGRADGGRMRAGEVAPRDPCQGSCSRTACQGRLRLWPWFRLSGRGGRAGRAREWGLAARRGAGRLHRRRAGRNQRGGGQQKSARKRAGRCGKGGGSHDVRPAKKSSWLGRVGEFQGSSIRLPHGCEAGASLKWLPWDVKLLAKIWIDIGGRARLGRPWEWAALRYAEIDSSNGDGYGCGIQEV
jgi:hypothetical protein